VQSKRREITWHGEDTFAGTIHYGGGNDVQPQALEGKRVVVVGGGAFAVEQTRMALLSGAEHVTVVARSGMTCIPRLADFWRTVS
jgi:cation diffusion facilitator CzcD-associated flavoprotein CzcO